jgi:hypothetical protein
MLNKMFQHGVGHLALELQAEDLTLSKTRVSLQGCNKTSIYDCLLI